MMDHGSGELRILIVDDSPEEREICRRQLCRDADTPYEILEAASS